MGVYLPEAGGIDLQRPVGNGVPQPRRPGNQPDPVGWPPPPRLPARPWRAAQDAQPAVVAANHLDAGEARPRRRRVAHAGGAQRAELDRLDVVGAMAAQAERAVGGDRPLDAATPAE